MSERTTEQVIDMLLTGSRRVLQTGYETERFPQVFRSTGSSILRLMKSEIDERYKNMPISHELANDPNQQAAFKAFVVATQKAREKNR